MTPTSKVRVLVAIDTKGVYEAHGYTGMGDDKDIPCGEDVTEPYHYVWIEADAPLPEEITVQGVVVEKSE